MSVPHFIELLALHIIVWIVFASCYAPFINFKSTKLIIRTNERSNKKYYQKSSPFYFLEIYLLLYIYRQLSLALTSLLLKSLVLVLLYHLVLNFDNELEKKMLI